MSLARALGMPFSDLLALPRRWVESLNTAPTRLEPAREGEPARSRAATVYEADKLREFKAAFAPKGAA